MNYLKKHNSLSGSEVTPTYSREVVASLRPDKEVQMGSAFADYIERKKNRHEFG